MHASRDLSNVTEDTEMQQLCVYLQIHHCTPSCGLCMHTWYTFGLIYRSTLNHPPQGCFHGESTMIQL